MKGQVTGQHDTTWASKAVTLPKCERNDFVMIPNKEVRVHNSDMQNGEEDQFRLFVCF